MKEENISSQSVMDSFKIKNEESSMDFACVTSDDTEVK